MRIIDLKDFEFTAREGKVAFSRDVSDAVAGIYQEIAVDGDAAVRRLSKKFDGVDITDLFVSNADWADGIERVSAPLRQAIANNLGRIRAFHEAQQVPDMQMETAPGLTLGRKRVPYQSVACYVPGGRASYPSTVLMTATLAKIAGVADIIIATPPGSDGTVNPAVLYAAKLAGATRILRVGGAHAIAAFALGTETVPRVQAIVGPGNQYVTAAKSLAGCHTDAPAGPSELLVLADETALAAKVCWDLLAQAEHDPDAQVLLVTTSKELASQVKENVAVEANQAQRAGIIAAALENGVILVAKSMAEAVSFSNRYAPEHLEIFTANPEETFSQITAAGSVFLGENTPVSLGDYGSGTNHVLPTMGQAALRGGLSLDDFCTTITWQTATKAGLSAVASDITILADSEGLQMHAEAVRRRL
jgi:histidinol dehydrogenase